jgi:hypothetical protein
MSTVETHASGIQSTLPPIQENRSAPRQPISSLLWMIDHDGSTVLRCRCLDRSDLGMRLRVPLGYGVSKGQRYELRSHLPGDAFTPGFGVVGQRWVTVVRTQILLDADSDYLDVGVVMDDVESSLHFAAAAPAATPS